MGWRWVETYIWAKPNAIPGRFGPRTKDSFEYVYHFARGAKPYFDLNGVRVPYKADAAEIQRRNLDTNGRKNTVAGFGRDRTKTYLLGGADPGNVVNVAQSYNQHYGVDHSAAMPEGLAEFFIKAASPKDGIVLDPFAGSATTVVVARRLGRKAGGIEIHERYVTEARRRIAENIAIDTPGRVTQATAG
jgi:DNA modification methylase